MDQLKEFLRQAVKYRFWIAVGVSALFCMTAYFLSAGSLAQAQKTKTDEIKGAFSGVKKYESAEIRNGEWSKIVTEKTGVLSNDVVASWTKLYERQAPLLDWPKEVPQLKDWGRAWPKNTDPQLIQQVGINYGEVYPDFVEKVYETFKPFDTTTGKGIVAAPPKESLLQPAVFAENSPPTLGRVWSAQERLWIQRTLLDVVKKVNDKVKAKNWDQAAVKQILSLEVASAAAQDQKSRAKGEALAPAEDIPDPSKPPAPVDKSSTTSFGSASKADGDKNYYLPSPNKNQFFIVPVAMTVYIDQERINDFLVEFQNSPMAIQVLDFEMMPPSTTVTKPQKGQDQSSFGFGTGGGSIGMGDSPMMGTLSKGMMTGRSRGNNPGMTSDPNASYNKMAGGLTTGGGSAKAKARETGTDVSNENLAKLAGKGKKSRDSKKSDGEKDNEKDKEKEDEVKIANPYFNVVEVRIRGQARFYYPPPAPATPPATSPGTTPAPSGPGKDATAKTETPKADTTKTGPAKNEPGKADAKTEPAKDGSAKADAKTEPAKTGDAPKADAKAKDAETPKADAKPKDVETPKTDAKAKDAETPKADGAKGEPAKNQDKGQSEPPKDDPSKSKDQSAAPKG